MAARFFVCCIIFFVVPLCVSSVPPGRHRSSSKGIIRNKRETCVDGTYESQGLTCCLCAPGQLVVEHCTSNLKYGKCERCEDGTYSSHPSSQKTCQPCVSCEQPNANLEEEEPCTAGNNTKCRCKKDHFCSSKECIICHPCKICGIGGIKEDCTATSDTVCNDAGGAIAGIVILVTGAIVVAGCVVIRRKTHKRKIRKQQEGKDEGGSQELDVLLPDEVNLEPLLPDIAMELGWKDMKSVAVHSGVAMAVIESCKMDYPYDTNEQTLQLLKRWVEKEDRDAANKLIQILKNKDKKSKAEKISKILSEVDSAPAGNS